MDVHPQQLITVLVADDDQDIRLVLRAILEVAGYQVSEASSGLDVLREVKASPPDLILLDLSMPKLDGIEVLRQLKRNPATSDIAVVIVTASGDEALAKEAIATGAFGYIVKPWDEGQIEKTVAAALGKEGVATS